MKVENGQFWHHLKSGQIACVLGIAPYYDKEENSVELYANVLSCDRAAAMKIFRKGGSLYHQDYSEQDYVIYVQNGEIWARRLEEFTDGRYLLNSDLR